MPNWLLIALIVAPFIAVQTAVMILGYLRGPLWFAGGLLFAWVPAFLLTGWALNEHATPPTRCLAIVTPGDPPRVEPCTEGDR